MGVELMENKNKETKEEKKKNKKIEKEKIKEEKKQAKAEKKERRRKSIGWKIFKIIILIIILALLIFVGVFTYRVAKNGWGLQGIVAAAMGHDENTLKDLDPINFLLVGISGCEEDYKLADTIMVCSYNPKTQSASILSIPRDTYVGTDKSKASASYKINAVYRNGQNIDGMIESIEEITELEIDNYIIIDTDALVELVDAIGGVTFNVPIDMKYDDPTQDLHIDLKAGEQVLTGEQAEWLVRFRHNNDGTSYSTEYGDNDIGRMRTQREFLKEVMKQTLKAENILKLSKIAEIAFNNITTNMTYDTIKDYIPYAVSFNTDNLQTGVLPGTAEYANKVAIYTVNKKQTQNLVEELFMQQETEDVTEYEVTNTSENTITNTQINQTVVEETTEEKIKIELLNGSGKEENLTKAIERLEQKGYEIVKTGETTTTSKTSIINRSNQETAVSTQLKKDFKVGTVIKRYKNSKIDYTIIIGKDFK
jgi:LCP family protein required for cell wall assembly